MLMSFSELISIWQGAAVGATEQPEAAPSPVSKRAPARESLTSAPPLLAAIVSSPIPP